MNQLQSIWKAAAIQIHLRQNKGVDMAKAVRLDKFLADAGKGTRSEAKKFIQKGQVQVNGTLAKKPELKVDPIRG